jgi:hypothetical protein
MTPLFIAAVYVDGGESVSELRLFALLDTV